MNSALYKLEDQQYIKFRKNFLDIVINELLHMNQNILEIKTSSELVSFKGILKFYKITTLFFSFWMKWDLVHQIFENMHIAK